MAHHGMTLEQMWEKTVEQNIKDIYGQVYTPEIFDKYMNDEYYQGWEEYESSETNVFTIDNNNYGKEGIKHLRDIVGLSGDFEYDTTAIENVQQGRYAEMNIEAWTADKDAKEKDESAK